MYIAAVAHQPAQDDPVVLWEAIRFGIRRIFT